MSVASLRQVVHVVDDDNAVRDSLSLLLGLRGYATRTFASGDAFLAEIDASASGCVLLDLRMPGVEGLAVQSALATRGIGMPIIVLTAHGDAASARAALKAGAFEFLEKPVDDALLGKTIEAALARDAQERALAGRREVLRRQLERLTPREREVLDRVVRGQHNREIALEFGISPRTVEVHKARIMDKLQVERMPELIRIAIELGLVPDTGA
ncbi:MAG: response regulator transcription factor [Betaproteobacteria bacterium]|nr:response regulator transcription factor [Betaproteobacteria bacterium]MDE2359960.1 response regulator transcription factor [Betaproteobacteria bacterium]